MSTSEDPILNFGPEQPRERDPQLPESGPGAAADVEALLASWPLWAASTGSSGPGADGSLPPGAEVAEADPVEAALRVEALASGGGEPALLASGGPPLPGTPSFQADARLLGDVAFALTQPTPAVRAHLEAAARAAFAASQRAVSPAGAVPASAGPRALGGPSPALRPARPAGPDRRLSAPLRAAAALLLVGVGLLALVGPPTAQAEPVLALDGLERFTLGSGASRFVSEGAMTARPGQRFVAGLQELLSLHLSGGGRVVLAQGEALDVATWPGSGREAVLRLTTGEVLVDTREGPAAVLLARPADGVPLGLLEVQDGAAHVASGLGPDGGPAVALVAGARARFTPLSGAALNFEGPTHVLLSARGLSALGPPAQALFRELELLGGPLAPPVSEPFVEARRWRVLSGQGVRGGVGLRLRPTAGDAEDPQRREVLLGWLPDPSALSARRLRLMLQGPAGLTVGLPDLLPADAVAGRLEPSAEGAEPGLVTLDLALPAGWPERLEGRELRLALRWPEGGPGATAWVRLDGAAFAPARRPDPDLPEGR